jgi:nucleoside-diphosphate-sugar epimerase
VKVLLTGAGGFLGPHVAESLLANGVTDLRLQYRLAVPQSRLMSLRQRFPAAHLESVTANLLAQNALQGLLDGIDCIVHAAAGTRGAAADMFLNTVVATRNLLDAAVAARVRRIVLISSFSVYRTESLARGTLLTESSPVEPVGVAKGPYGYSKTRQEHLFQEYQQRYGFEAVILRPGVIYGPAGGAFSPRVGISALGWFFNLGGRARLPLTYVENCADAIARAAMHSPPGGIFNVVDDDLPTCSDYLRRYRREVRKLRVMRLPYWAFLLAARSLTRYSKRSNGQLPAVFTPYIVRSMYRPLRYDNTALKHIGWSQRIPTRNGLEMTFEHLRRLSPGT